MPRPKEFNQEEVLQKAMITFWEKGYENTSISDLEESMGISRVSIYNSFTDKEGIFLEILSIYHTVCESFLDEAFQEKTLEALINFFHSIYECKQDASPQKYGCLTVNTVLDMGQFSERVEMAVKDHKDMMQERFKDLLEELEKEKIIELKFSVDDAAALLVGSLWGAMATIRLYRDAKEIKPMITAVISTIESWRIASPELSK